MSKQQYFSSLFRGVKGYFKFAKNIHDNEVSKGYSKTWRILNTYSSMQKTQAEIDKYLFEPGKKLLVDIEGDSIAEEVKGKFFARKEEITQDAESKLYSPTEEQVYNTNILAIGGLGFVTGRHLSALLKATAVLASKNSRGTESFYKAVAVMPEVDKEERYEAAEKYSMDSTYYPEYIKDRVKKFLIPKFIDIDEEKTIFDFPQSIALLSFSMGGREVMMMENALYDILTNEYSLSSDLVNRLMKNVKAVCIGYAPQLNVFKDEGFNKIIIFSKEDRAVLLPNDFYENLLIKTELSSEIVYIGDYSKLNSKLFNYLVVHNEKTEKDNILQDSLDHSISDYLCCVESFPDEVKETIGNSLVYNGFNNSFDEYYES